MSLKEIEGSPTLEMVNLVLQRIAAGEKVISLAIGEPSFDTPPEILEAAYKSMLSGDIHYVSSYGLSQVRESIVRKVKRKNHINATIPNTIFATTKFSVYATLVALSSKKFDVLIPDPGYFYREPTILAGGKPIYYKLNDDFSLDLTEIKKRTTAYTKAIFINSPSNPTGKVLSRKELEELYDFCLDNKIHVVSDEAYEDLLYGTNHFSIGSLEEEPKVVISLFSLSKSYSMTGWRSGYIVASEEIIRLINRFIEHTLTCFPPFIEKASAFALDNCERRIEEFRMELERRKKLMEEEISKIECFEANEIEGAFYAFPRCTINRTTRDLSKKILEKHNVATLPGTSFGPSGEGHFRLSFSPSQETISLAMGKIREFFREIA